MCDDSAGSVFYKKTSLFYQSSLYFFLLLSILLLITSFFTLAGVSATTANTIHGHEPQIASIPIVSNKRLTLLYQGVAYHQPFVIVNSKPNDYDLGILPFVLADPITYPSATASLWLPAVNHALDIPSQQVVSSASQYSIAQDWGDPGDNTYGSSIPGGGLSLFTSETEDNVPDDSLTGNRFMYKSYPGSVSTTRPNIYNTGVICIVD